MTSPNKREHYSVGLNTTNYEKKTNVINQNEIKHDTNIVICVNNINEQYIYFSADVRALLSLYL